MCTRALCLLAMIIPGAAPAAAQDTTAAPSIQDAPATGDRPSRDEVVVVTASRREEQLLNAPATMTVITEDEIATAAARTVPDLLRLVPGVNVARTSVRDVNVTTRAATGTLSDSMLVLLDGRSIYQDFFGFVMWDFLPVDVAEIKQVEVIRGPASAVWGANAMTGVVNVITKTPREMAGTTVGIRFGQFDRSAPGGRFDGGGLLSITAAHARVTNDRFAYKVSAGMLAEESLLRPTGTVPGTGRAYPSFDNPGTLQPRLDARADYDLADGQRRLVLAGGIAGTEGIIHTGLGPLDIQRGSTFKYGRITFTRRKMKVQAFVNAIDGESPASLLTAADGRPAQFRFENQAYDVEFSDLLLIGAHHLLSYGGNYRHNNFNLSFAPRGHRRDEGGAYVQDEIFLTARYRWVIGSRVDGFDVLERPIVSPRTTFLIKPTASQTFRLSFNRAFRAPSFVDSFLETSFLNEIDLGPAGAFHFPAFAGGNPALRQEALTAYEAGYVADIGRATLGVATYVNRTKDMIQFSQTAAYDSATPPPGWPMAPVVLDQLKSQGHALPLRFTYLNFNRIVDRGVELSADVKVTNAVSAFANYSWQAAPRPGGFERSEVNLPPPYRVHAGARIRRDSLFGSLSASAVGGGYWQDVLPGYEGRSRSYRVIDSAFGVNSGDTKMAVAVRATNLLDASIQQHVFGDIIRRAISAEMLLRF